MFFAIVGHKEYNVNSTFVTEAATLEEAKEAFTKAVGANKHSTAYIDSIVQSSSKIDVLLDEWDDRLKKMTNSKHKSELSARVLPALEAEAAAVQIVQHEVPGEVRRTAQYKEWIAKLQSTVEDGAGIKAIHISGDNVATGDSIIPAHFEVTRGDSTEMMSAAAGHFNTETLKYNLGAGLDGVEASTERADDHAVADRILEALTSGFRSLTKGAGRDADGKQSLQVVYDTLRSCLLDGDVKGFLSQYEKYHASKPDLTDELFLAMAESVGLEETPKSGPTWQDFEKKVGLASNGEESVPPNNKMPYDGSRGPQNAAKDKPKDPTKPGEHEGVVALITHASPGTMPEGAMDTIQIGDNVYRVLPHAWSGIQIGDEVTYTVAEPVDGQPDDAHPLVSAIVKKVPKGVEPPKLDTEDKVRKQIKAFGELIISPENSGDETADAPTMIDSPEKVAAFRQWLVKNARRFSILSDEVDGTTTFFIFDLEATKPLGKAKFVAHYTHGSGVYDASMKEGLPRSEFDDAIGDKHEDDLDHPSIRELLSYIDSNS